MNLLNNRDQSALLTNSKCLLVKRKSSDQNIVDSLKRVRISVSAGELRLRKDLSDCEDLISTGFVSIVQSFHEDPMSFKVSFKTSGAVYFIKIPRFYPHKPPEVYPESCPVELHQYMKEGKLWIPILQTKWLAVLTLRDIFRVLEKLSRGDFLSETSSSSVTPMSN